MHYGISTSHHNKSHHIILPYYVIEIEYEAVNIKYHDCVCTFCHAYPTCRWHLCDKILWAVHWLCFGLSCSALF